MPVIGDRRNDAIDVFIDEEFLITPRHRQIRFVGDLASQRVAAVV
jgi:hypothetical protein